MAAKLELVDAPFLRRYRRHAIVLNFMLAAALTPGQDPYSMVLMAAPMVVMYEVSILIARYVNPVSEVAVHASVRRRRRKDYVYYDEDEDVYDDDEVDTVYDGVERRDEDDEDDEADEEDDPRERDL